jgi:hypothetical protein
MFGNSKENGQNGQYQTAFVNQNRQFGVKKRSLMRLKSYVFDRFEL